MNQLKVGLFLAIGVFILVFSIIILGSNKSLFTNKNLIELNLGNNEINHDGIIGITSVLNWNNDTL